MILYNNIKQSIEKKKKKKKKKPKALSEQYLLSSFIGDKFTQKYRNIF